MPTHRRHCLAALAGLALNAPGFARATPRDRPALMLATDAREPVEPHGWLVSEKLDGVRAYWDGQALRYRSGGRIAAPAWFIRALPERSLDGELWSGRGRFETLVSTVRRERPDDSAWRAVRYALFDLPGLSAPFAERAEHLRSLVRRLGTHHVVAVPQGTVNSAADLQRRLADVVAQDGEGLMLHRAAAIWRPGRSTDLLKLKPVADAEAMVLAHEPGQGRHAGRLGALRVQTADGRVFRLGTGFSDAEREAPPPAGAVVSYRYRGLTEDGLPRFASFWRVRRLP